jgi:hypothetical protein
MSGAGGPDTGCEPFADGLAELALGTLVGEERASALAHVDKCPHCRATLEGMALTADALLQIAPVAEPPVGFESRLFTALRTEAAGSTDPASQPARRRADRRADPLSPRRRLSRLVGVAAAAALVLGMGFGIGRVSRRAAPRDELVVGHLTSAGEPRGDVVVAAGDPAWVVMTVEDAGTAATVVCQVTMDDGRTINVGAFKLAGGYGEWTAALTVDPHRIRSATLVAPDGHTVASATLSR